MRSIAVMNQKGGVGKTTTTINLSHALQEQGFKVCAIDLDPQSHLSLGMGLGRVEGVEFLAGTEGGRKCACPYHSQHPAGNKSQQNDQCRMHYLSVG